MSNLCGWIFKTLRHSQRTLTLKEYAAIWQLIVKYLKGQFLSWKSCNIYWKRRFSSLQDQLLKVEKIGLNNRISIKQNKNQHHTLWLWKYKCNVSGRRTRLTFTSRIKCLFSFQSFALTWIDKGTIGWNNYSHLSNKRGGWNKCGGGAKFAKSLNVEVGINVKGGILWEKLMRNSNKRGVEAKKN